MAISLAGAVRSAMYTKAVTGTDTGTLDEVNLLMDTALAWHFHKQNNPDASREKFILDYFAKRYKECTPVAKSNITRLCSYAGQTSIDPNSQKGNPVSLPMLPFKFDLLYSFVVGIEYALPDSFPFKKSMIEEVLDKIHHK